jgi:hypothetical protein
MADAGTSLPLEDRSPAPASASATFWLNRHRSLAATLNAKPTLNVATADHVRLMSHPLSETACTMSAQLMIRPQICGP